MDLKNKKTIISLIIGLAVFIAFIAVRADIRESKERVQTSAVNADKKELS